MGNENEVAANARVIIAHRVRMRTNGRCSIILNSPIDIDPKSCSKFKTGAEGAGAVWRSCVNLIDM
jgi:hypothetical protein